MNTKEIPPFHHFFEGGVLEELHDVTISSLSSSLLSENSNKAFAFYLPFKCGPCVRTDKLPNCYSLIHSFNLLIADDTHQAFEDFTQL